ncbi:Xaa-Pro peptidase family protein [Acidiplasma sp.]
MKSERIFDYVRDVDTALIINGGENQIDKTFFYITGAKSGIFEGSALFIRPDEVKIITSELEEQAARETGYDVIIFKTRDEFNEIIKKIFENHTNIGINYSAVSLEQYKNILKIIPDKEFIDISQSILEARKIKEDDEISKIREAAKIASDSLEDVIPKIREGMTEIELAAEVVYAMMKNGASGESFSTIVAFGKNSSMPHYFPGKTKLKKGDFVLIDYGAVYQRYCSDTTRTMVFGRASEEQKEI